jgi:predicted small secreted protein
MKEKTIKLLALLIVLIGVFASCNTEETETYPKDISFTEYALQGNFCQWVDLPYNEKIIIINNNKELEKFISCEEVSYFALDFSKNSLLLISGKTDKGIVDISAKGLQQVSSDIFNLSIEITVCDTAVNKVWYKAILVEKLHNNSTVELTISYNKQEVFYPIEIPFEDYSLEGTTCQWIELNYDDYCDYYFSDHFWFKYKLQIIDNYEMLDNILTECNTYNEIDFRQQTLLFAPFIFFNGVKSVTKQFHQISENDFLLLLHIRISETTELRKWTDALLVPKLPPHAKVTLSVIIN